jgi:hypothetical protein
MKHVSMIATAVTTAALLAGCSGSDPSQSEVVAELRAATAASPSTSPSPSPPFAGVRTGEILKRTERDVARATSFHVVLNIVSQKGPLKVDLSLGRGLRAVGTITQDGHAVRIRRIRNDLWVRAGDGFWQEQVILPSAIPRVADRWVKMSRKNDLTGGFFDLTDLSAIRKDYVVDAVSGVSYTSRVAGQTIDGHRTVGLVARARDILDDSEYRITLNVAGDGPAVPLRYVRQSSRKKHAETRLFSRWNEKVTVSPPTGAITMG